MEQEQLEQLEQKLAALDAGAEIFEVIKGLAGRVGELECEVGMLAEAVAKFYEVLRGFAQLDALQRAQVEAQEAAIAKRRKKPEPEPPAGGGGTVN